MFVLSTTWSAFKVNTFHTSLLVPVNPVVGAVNSYLDPSLVINSTVVGEVPISEDPLKWCNLNSNGPFVPSQIVVVSGPYEVVSSKSTFLLFYFCHGLRKMH